MMEKIVKKYKLDNLDSRKEDLKFWLSHSPKERLECVELLRRRYHGNTERLQRVIRVIKQA
ncbi:hypothetical protein KKC59_00885 [bacterium]|nr:hypothetical protein [bacterium]